jgi:hypothetical protein
MLILSTTIIGLGLLFAEDPKYSPVNFHDGYRVIIWAYFISFRSFLPSLVLFIVGAILAWRSRVTSRVSPL